MVLVHTACAAPKNEKFVQEYYVSETGQWKASLSMNDKKDAHLVLKSTDQAASLDLWMSPSKGDLEIIEKPNNEAIPARQYLKTGTCWAALAVSTDGRYLRFEQSGCGIKAEQIFLERSTE
jgi:hypothetical protein